MNVVLDTNVVVSAIFWPGESRQCLSLWAKRRFHLAITTLIFDEYCEIAHRLERRKEHVQGAPPPPLAVVVFLRSMRQLGLTTATQENVRDGLRLDLGVEFATRILQQVGWPSTAQPTKPAAKSLELISSPS